MRRAGAGATACTFAVLMVAGCSPGEDWPKPKPVPPRNSESFTKMKNAYLTSVEPILKAKCFDCHSDRTDYPWYYAIPGVNILIDRDIKKARRIMDYSRGFPFKGIGTDDEKMEGLNISTRDDTMPPLLYRIGHPGSGLTEEEVKTILAWINQNPPEPTPGEGAAVR